MFIIPFIIIGGVSIYFAIKIVKGYINSLTMMLMRIEMRKIDYIYNRKYERLSDIEYKPDIGLNISGIPSISISGTHSIIIKSDNSCNIEGQWKFKKLSYDSNEYRCINGSNRGDIGDGWSKIHKIQEYFPTYKYEHSLLGMLDVQDILTITSKDSYFKNNLK